MDRFINDIIHKELYTNPDPVQVSETLKTEEGRTLAEEFLEDILPLPYGLDSTGESAPSDLAMLVLQKIVFPYL